MLTLCSIAEGKSVQALGLFSRHPGWSHGGVIGWRWGASVGGPGAARASVGLSRGSLGFPVGAQLSLHVHLFVFHLGELFSLLAFFPSGSYLLTVCEKTIRLDLLPYLLSR